MAFPWVWANNFETGAHGATASSGTLIDFPHYTELARQSMAPYRGAYCARVRLAGGTTSQFIREDTAFDDLLADDTTRWLRWYFYLGKDLVMADTDKFSLVELESTLNTTTEVAAGIQRTGDNLEFWYNETQAAASPTTVVLGTTSTALGRWYHAELQINMDNGLANDGTITGHIDDAAQTAITSLDQAAIVDGKFGVIGPDAGTSGTVLIDQIIYDDAQIYRNRERFPGLNVWQYHTNDHPVIGAARFSAAVTGTTGDAIVSLYDTDGVPNNLTPFVVLSSSASPEFVPGHDIFEVNHGCYAVMSGTAPQAFFSIMRGGVVSDGQYVTRGHGQKSPKP